MAEFGSVSGGAPEPLIDEALRGLPGDERSGLANDVLSNLFGDPLHLGDGFHIMYNPAKAGWSTPEWNGYPAYPVQ